MKKTMGCILCMVLLTTMLIGCSTEDAKHSTGGEISVGNTSGTVDEIQIAEEIEIDTPYGTLYFPNQWEEFVTAEQKEDDDTVVVTFTATVQDTTYPLFEVTIGGTDGVKAGELTDAKGTKRTVYMQVYELEEDPNLTDSEQNRLYAMQEDLNYLIDHLE